MQYPCPKASDLANIHALNTEYLSLAVALGALPGLNNLSRRETERLAAVPYLLFSLDFENDELWERLFDGQTDLVDAALQNDTRWHSLIAGSLAFLWSTAQTNPYAVRLFTGASAYWCRQLALRRLICICNRAMRVGIKPTCRLETTGEDWRTLLSDGVSRHPQRREASVLGLFQSFSLRSDPPAMLASAACRIPNREKTRHR